MPKLTIGHGNIYVGNKTPGKALNEMRSHDVDSWGWNEAIHVLPLIRKVDGYRVTVGAHDGSFQHKRSVFDTPILTKDDHKPLGSLAIQASEAVDPIKIAPARTLTASLYEHPIGNVAHISGHPNAGVIGKPKSVPRVREYAEFMATLDRLIVFLKGEGFLTVVTMDANWRKDAPDAAWDPQNVMDKRGLETYWEGLEMVAYDDRLARVGKPTIIPKGNQTGADHPWIVLTLGRK